MVPLLRLRWPQERRRSMTTPKSRTSKEAAIQKFKDEIAHWRGRAEEAEGRVQERTNTNPPPMVAPGVPYMDLVLASGRQLRFTANFGAFLAMVGVLLEDGIEWDAIDQLPAEQLASVMMKPGYMEALLARAGMALQPDENWGLVIAQLDAETCVTLITWLTGALIAGQAELATAAQEEAPGEAADSSPTPLPG